MVVDAIVKVAYDKIWCGVIKHGMIKRGVVKHVSSLHVLSLHSMFYHSSPFHVLSFTSKSKTWQKWYTWETTMVQNAVTMLTFRLKELIQVFLFLKMPKILGLSDDAIKTEKKWTSSSPPFFLRDSRASETRARVKITPREKRRHACRLFSRGVIFTRARVSLALLSLRKNGGLLVV